MRLTLFSLLLVLPMMAAAQVYRWVDEQGKVHFTQTPPPQGKFKGELKEVPPAPPPGSLGGPPPSLGEYGGKMQVEREQREQAQAQVEKASQRRKQNCGAAKRRQAFLNRFDGRMNTITEDGGKEAWAPERYAAERSQVETEIAANCESQ